MHTSRVLLAVWAAVLLTSACGQKNEASAEPPAEIHETGLRAPNTAAGAKREAYSPYVGEFFPKRVFFGDTHVHTSYSYDAGMIGDRLGPDEAYRFARGEMVTASLGEQAKLIRPLDFLVIADHAESLGIAPMLAEGNQLALEDPIGRELYDLVQAGKRLEAYRKFASLRAVGTLPLHNEVVRRSMWDRIIASAERHYDPGVFTSLIGYEYTSAPSTNNLHRVVVFRDGGDRAGSVLPFSSAESSNPEDLWTFMESYEARTGGRILAIPHNGNLSNGLMFDRVDYSGAPLDAEYSTRRQRFEPLYEVTQIKGDGETHPLLSPNDEFADFWTWDRGNFGFATKTPDMLPREYARAALNRGLQYESELGVNPFKFGMIGSSDSHTSLSTTREENFFSKATPGEPGAGQYRYDAPIIQKYDNVDVDVRVYSYESAAAGLTAVWASDNTREAIFDAMARKEVYATTGSRIRLRLFGGFDFRQSDATLAYLARTGYDRGVPMGGTLPPAPDGTSPRLLIQAVRDPDGANLDRIQVVKGWLNGEGELHEHVYDVAWAGERTIGEDGKLPSIRSTVRGATYVNSIGEPVLTTVWRDADFDRSERAFYYVRVLEIPTPTWLAHDKAFYGDAITLPEDAVLSHQERAYSSPIWYTPKS